MKGAKMRHRKSAAGKRKIALPDWAVAIGDLKVALGCKTQDEFAFKIRVKQGTASAWLRGDLSRRPSADAFFRMASLVPENHAELASRLLRLAGTDEQTIFTVARKLMADKYVFEGSDGKDIRVSPSEESPKALSAGDIFLSQSCVKDAAFARYMIVDEEFLRPYDIRSKDDAARKVFEAFPDTPVSTAWGLLRSGDILLLDVSQNSSPILRPFWGSYVVVKTNYYARFGGATLVAGELVAVSSIRDVSARLFVPAEDHSSPLDIGVWTPPRATVLPKKLDALEPEYPMERDEGEDLYERARIEMQLDPGFTIVGIVTGWWRPRRKDHR
jgi:hypothetical protein